MGSLQDPAALPYILGISCGQIAGEHMDEQQGSQLATAQKRGN